MKSPAESRLLPRSLDSHSAHMLLRSKVVAVSELYNIHQLPTIQQAEKSPLCHFNYLLVISHCIASVHRDNRIAYVRQFALNHVEGCVMLPNRDTVLKDVQPA